MHNLAEMSLRKEFEKWRAIRAGVLAWVAWVAWWVACSRGWRASVGGVGSVLAWWRASVGGVGGVLAWVAC